MFELLFPTILFFIITAIMFAIDKYFSKKKVLSKKTTTEAPKETSKEDLDKALRKLAKIIVDVKYMKRPNF